MAVLNQIRNALNGVVVIDQAASPNPHNAAFNANKDQSSRYETEE